MKKLIILILAGLVIFPATTGARKIYRERSRERSRSVQYRPGLYHFDQSGFSLGYEVEDDRIFLYTEDEEDEIEIDSDYTVSINGRSITLDQKQRGRVQGFYHQVLKVNEIAVAMGKIGGKMGRVGGKMGIVGARMGRAERLASYKIARETYADLISDRRYQSYDYDDDEFEDDMEDLEEDMDRLEEEMDVLEDEMEDSEDEMEYLSDILDEHGEVLDKYSDEMEEESEKLEDDFYDMLDAIPELDKLDWN